MYIKKAVIKDIRAITHFELNFPAPAGWHVPTDAEWTTLINFLGGAAVAGGKMKATTLWNSPNDGASNSSGFTGLPAGNRDLYGTFNNIGNGGHFWFSTEYNTYYAWNHTLSYTSSSVNRGGNGKQYGYSVRCVKD